MPVGIGSKSRLAFVVETVFGTFPSTPTGTQIGMISESIENTRNTFKSEEINPTRQVTSVRSGNVQAGGDIMTEMSPNAIGMFLRHLLCNTATSTTITPTAISNNLAVTRGSYYSANSRTYLCTRPGTTSAAAVANFTSQDSNEEFTEGTGMFQYYAPLATAIYQHVIAGGVTKPTGGFSMQREVFVDGGSQFFRYIGGRPNTWNVTIPQEGIVTCGFGFLFLDLDTVASTTIWSTLLTPVDEPFAANDVVIQTRAPAGSYVDDFSLNSASLSLTNNYDAGVYTTGQRRRRDLPEGRREITGSFSALFEDMTKFNYFRNESVIGLRITLHTLGMYMEIDLPSNKLSGGTPLIGGNGVIASSFNFETFNSGGSHDIQVTLRNSTANYT